MPSRLRLIPSDSGEHAGGELRLGLAPHEVLARIRARTDELHAWQGGGVAFGKKPFLGEVKRNTFRVRTLSFRRDGAVGFLVGEVEPREGGTLLRYRIESPLGFVRMLPIAAIAPAALLGIGGYLASPVLAPGGGVGRIAIVAACALFGLLLGFAISALVLRMIRADRERLLGFLDGTLGATAE